MATRMQQRKGTAAQWTSANPILNAGEIGWESDTNQFKIGDGTNHWDDLPYFLDETSLSTQLGDYIETSQLGVANGVATLNSSGKLESSQVPNIDELAQDAVDSALVAGTGITKTYNDNSNTITVSVDTSVIATKAELAEVAQDSVNDALIAGTGLDKTYDDNSNTVTIAIDSTVATVSGAQTLLDKTINLANNTIIGTLDQFNAAMSDGNFASASELSYAVEYHSNSLSSVHGVGGNVVGTSDTQTLTNKTISFANNTITGTLAEFNSAISDDNILPVSGGTMTGALTLSGAPTQDLHAATKAYVDAVSQGLHIHPSARVATSANVSISTDLEAGDVIDGVTLAEGDRVLVKSQTNSAQNGIYVVQASGAALRASDFNEPQEVDGGDFIFVTSGTLYNDTGWVQVTDNVVTIGTDPIVFTQFSGAGTYTAGTGLVLNGSEFSISNTVVTTSDAQTLSSKSISLGTNTLTGNISQFNEALSDANFATTDGYETLTNKTISVAGNNIITIASTNIADWDFATKERVGTLLNTANGISKTFDSGSNTYTLALDSTVVKLEDGQTLLNKTINLANNTVSGTLAQFNTALSDADFATIAGSETLTNKTISLANNTVSGTFAQLNATISDAVLVSLTGNETLTNKTIDLANNTVTGTIERFNSALSDADFATLAGTETLTNKSINLANNTVTGTITQFNTALSDGSFATLDGSEALTNKTVNLANNTLVGTISQFNTALADGDFATLTGTETLTNKTIDSANNTITVTSQNISDFTESTVDVVANAITSGTHTNISVTYDDNAGTISITAAAGYTDEQAQDAIGNNLGTGLSYDDSSGAISVNTATIQARVADVSDTEIGYLNGVTSAIQTQIDSKLNKAGDTMTGALTLSGAPTDPLHAATKGYVDAAVEGLHVHPSVKAATTGNITLSTDVENGDTLDGITLATGDRILVKDQTTKSQNGIYVVSASGAPTRATDFDTAAEIDSGDFVFVDSGTTYGNTGWVQINTPATIGTDAIEFVQFSGAGTYTASGGVKLTGVNFTLHSTAADTFISNPTSSNLASLVSDETGSGSLVFGTSPTLVTPRVQMALNAQTGTTYTAALTDASNRLVTLDNTSAITLTLPPSVFSVGDSIIFQQTNTGQVTFAAGAGVTITSAGTTTAAPKIRTRYSSATAICTASNTFTVIGDIV